MNYREREDAVLDYIDEHPGCAGRDVVLEVGDKLAWGDLRRLSLRGRLIVDATGDVRRYWPTLREDSPEPGLCGICRRRLGARPVAEERKTGPGGMSQTWLYHRRCWLWLARCRRDEEPDAILRVAVGAIRLGRGARRGAE